MRAISKGARSGEPRAESAIFHEVLLSLTWPSRSYLLGVASSLATAWVVIALVAGIIRNPFVYRLVAISIAAMAT